MSGDEQLERRADDLVPTGVARRYLVRAKDAEDPLERASLAAVADAAAQLSTAEELAVIVKATRASTEALEELARIAAVAGPVLERLAATETSERRVPHP